MLCFPVNRKLSSAESAKMVCWEVVILVGGPVRPVNQRGKATVLNSGFTYSRIVTWPDACWISGCSCLAGGPLRSCSRALNADFCTRHRHVGYSRRLLTSVPEVTPRSPLQAGSGRVLPDARSSDHVSGCFCGQRGGPRCCLRPSPCSALCPPRLTL